MNITKSVPSNVPQMPICIGMDLHSDNVVVSVCTTEVTEDGLRTKWLTTKRFSIHHKSARAVLLDEFLPQLFERSSTVAVVESTFNWYWVADAFEKRGWTLRIADPCTVNSAKVKAANDYTDAKFLAECLRQGTICSYAVMPREERAERDWNRLRLSYVRKRSDPKTRMTNFFLNHLGDRISANSMVSKAYKLLESDQPRPMGSESPQSSRWRQGSTGHATAHRHHDIDRRNRFEALRRLRRYHIDAVDGLHQAHRIRVDGINDLGASGIRDKHLRSPMAAQGFRDL